MEGAFCARSQQRTPLTRVIMASLIGTTIEWYDFFLYGIGRRAGFQQAVLPDVRPAGRHLLAFATYAVGFVARPFGGIVFGHYGDRIGRKTLLMLSLVMMGLATVADRPAADATPASASGRRSALIVLRVRPGLRGRRRMGRRGADGRRAWRRRGGAAIWASWPQAGVPLGSLLSAGILALMAGFQSEADFVAWGWRVPFLLSARAGRRSAGTSATASPRAPMFEAEIEAAEAPPKLPGDGGAPRAAARGAARRGPAGRREHRLLHPDRLLADLPGRRRERKPQPRARRLADRRGGPVRRHSAAREPVRPHRPARRSMRSARSGSASSASSSSRCWRAATTR